MEGQGNQRSHPSPTIAVIGVTQLGSSRLGIGASLSYRTISPLLCRLETI
jgi:hypothetical protein